MGKRTLMTAIWLVLAFAGGSTRLFTPVGNEDLGSVDVGAVERTADEVTQSCKREGRGGYADETGRRAFLIAASMKWCLRYLPNKKRAARCMMRVLSWMYGDDAIDQAIEVLTQLGWPDLA